jgi:chemotaxis protein methyltransferase WspC
VIEQCAKHLWETIGLDPASIGMPSIERAVQQRIAACRVAGPQAYMQHLRASAGETQALIEAVVVPETWFFRDPKAFEAVADHARKLSGQDRLHFLCIPCSTGEEPYSLAMTLLDSGIPASRFRIDAMDVSERVISIARAGLYGRNSFRGRDLAFRDRHFEPTPAGYLLSPVVRECVQFHRGNLLDDASMARGRTYDAVFCRNLLIYFDAATQRRVIATLERLLAPRGLFCVGPAETGLLAPHDFTHTRISLAFAFRKGKEHTSLESRPVRKRAIVAPAPVVKPKPAAKPARKPAVTPSAPVLLPEPLADLAEAARLADMGRLGEVASICRASIKQSGASAQAFYLLGLVSDAAGRDEEAAMHYRKALYLDPQHHDTLLHFSLLTARRGDATAAHALRERARRCVGKAA